MIAIINIITLVCFHIISFLHLLFIITIINFIIIGIVIIVNIIIITIIIRPRTLSRPVAGRQSFSMPGHVLHSSKCQSDHYNCQHEHRHHRYRYRHQHDNHKDLNIIIINLPWTRTRYHFKNDVIKSLKFKICSISRFFSSSNYQATGKQLF